MMRQFSFEKKIYIYNGSACLNPHGTGKLYSIIRSIPITETFAVSYPKSNCTMVFCWAIIANMRRRPQKEIGRYSARTLLVSLVWSHWCGPIGMIPLLWSHWCGPTGRPWKPVRPWKEKLCPDMVFSLGKKKEGRKDGRLFTRLSYGYVTGMPTGMPSLLAYWMSHEHICNLTNHFLSLEWSVKKKLEMGPQTDLGGTCWDILSCCLGGVSVRGCLRGVPVRGRLESPYLLGWYETIHVRWYKGGAVL